MGTSESESDFTAVILRAVKKGIHNMRWSLPTIEILTLPHGLVVWPEGRPTEAVCLMASKARVSAERTAD